MDTITLTSLDSWGQEERVYVINVDTHSNLTTHNEEAIISIIKNNLSKNFSILITPTKG